MKATSFHAARPRVAVVLLIATALVHSGCVVVEGLVDVGLRGIVTAATTDKYVGSWPQPPYGPDAFLPGAVAVIYGPGFSLRLQVQNHRRKLQLPYEPPLAVWIQLDPEDGSFQFDPREVTLVDPEGRTLEPIGFHGPGVALSPQAVPEQMVNAACGLPGLCFNCDVRPFRKSQQPFAVPLPPQERPDGPIPIDGPACFVLLFDAEPEGKGSLELAVEGVRRKDKRIALPAAPFRRRAKGKF